LKDKLVELAIKVFVLPAVDLLIWMNRTLDRIAERKKK